MAQHRSASFLFLKAQNHSASKTHNMQVGLVGLEAAAGQTHTLALHVPRIWQDVDVPELYDNMQLRHSCSDELLMTLRQSKRCMPSNLSLQLQQAALGHNCSCGCRVHLPFDVSEEAL